MATETITDGLKDFKYTKGETFDALQLQLYKKGTTTAPDNTLSTVRMTIRKGDKKGKVQKEVYNGSGITIDDATNWIITIASFDIDWEPGKYFYEIKTVDSLSLKDSPQKGEIDIIQNVPNE